MKNRSGLESIMFSAFGINLAGWVSWMAIAGFVVATWLGFYLATHATGSKSARLATLYMLAVAGYFLHAVLCLHVPAVQAGFLWRRFLGWFAVPPFPLWYHLTVTLLPPRVAARQRLLVLFNYGLGGLLVGLWLLAPWTFSTDSLVPLELTWPLGIYAVVVSLGCLLNLWVSQRQTALASLRRRQKLLALATLLMASGGVYWPIIAAFNFSFLPTTALALGELVQVLGIIVLGYTIAKHNAFIIGKWVGRDFLYHLVSIATLVGLYLVAVLGAGLIAQTLQFDVLTLILVVVVGLVIGTHLLTDRARAIWDAIFFRQLYPIKTEMRSLAHSLGQIKPFERQMQNLVEQTASLTGASVACLAMWEENQLVIRASTERSRIGHSIPRPTMSDARLIWRSDKPGGNGSNGSISFIPPGCENLVLAEPMVVFGQEVGILLLGDRGIGEGYNREDRVWVAALAANAATWLERSRLREEATSLLAELAEEIDEIQAQEAELQPEEITPNFRLNYQELREAIHCFSRPDNLAAIVTREESSLAQLPAVVAGDHSAAVISLQKLMSEALESLKPSPLPSLDELRERALSEKRRRRLPTTVADYYTLRLIMAGYSHEAVAEQLEVSPRQVRNYLERAVSRLGLVIEETTDQ